LLQFLAMPGCVGPGGVTLVVVGLLVDAGLLVDVADGGGTEVRVALLGLETQYYIKCQKIKELNDDGGNKLPYNVQLLETTCSGIVVL
jgi:hypothetical protein